MPANFFPMIIIGKLQANEIMGSYGNWLLFRMSHQTIHWAARPGEVEPASPSTHSYLYSK